MINSQTFSVKISELGASFAEDEIVPTALDLIIEDFFALMEEEKKAVMTMNQMTCGEYLVVSFTYTDQPRAGKITPADLNIQPIRQ